MGVNAAAMSLIVLFIYAIVGTELFRSVGEGCLNEGAPPWHLTSRGGCLGEEYFGTFIDSLYSLFQVLTGDSWSEAITRPLFYGQPATTQLGVMAYFLSYILVEVMVLINVVLSVLLENFVVDEDNDAISELDNEMLEARLLVELATLANEVSACQKYLTTFTAELRTEIELTYQDLAKVRREITPLLEE